MFKVYSKPNCPYCVRAKELLTLKGLPFEVLDLDVGQVKDINGSYYTVPQLQKLVPGARTVPQIFEDGVLIGGFDALQRHFMNVKETANN